MQPVAPGAAGQEGQPEPLRQYWDFHHRGCALHILCFYHFEQQLEMPGWLVGLAAGVPCKYKGEVSQLDWVSEGLKRAAALQYGSVPLTWLDVVQRCVRATPLVVGDRCDCLRLRLQL